MSLTAALEYIWHAAGLLGQEPSHQLRWSDLCERLSTVVDAGRLGATSMRSVIYVVPPFSPDTKASSARDWALFTGRFECADQTVPMFLVLGERPQDVLRARIQASSFPPFRE